MLLEKEHLQASFVMDYTCYFLGLSLRNTVKASSLLKTTKISQFPSGKGFKS